MAVELDVDLHGLPLTRDAVWWSWRSSAKRPVEWWVQVRAQEDAAERGLPSRIRPSPSHGLAMARFYVKGNPGGSSAPRSGAGWPPGSEAGWRAESWRVPCPPECARMGEPLPATADANQQFQFALELALS